MPWSRPHENCSHKTSTPSTVMTTTLPYYPIYIHIICLYVYVYDIFVSDRTDRVRDTGHTALFFRLDRVSALCPC
jgi:hypothetical protein